MELAWAATGFDDLIKKLQSLRRDLDAFIGDDKDVDSCAIKLELLNYLNKGLFSKKRVAATHLLVFIYDRR
jgi:hypothetical protein